MSSDNQPNNLRDLFQTTVFDSRYIDRLSSILDT